MFIKRMRTISLFLIIATGSSSLCGNTVMLAGYLTPAPDEVTTAVMAPEPTVGGIKMSYAGYVNITNNDGYFSFPWHSATPNEVRIIITPETDFDRLKNTVSQLTMNEVRQNTLRIYRIKKRREGDEQIAQNASQKSDPLALQPIDPTQWYLEVTEEKTLGKQGLSSHDLIIHSDPSFLYLEKGMHFTEENSHFIIPNGVIYILKTPPALELSDTDADQLSLSVDANVNADKVPAAGSELAVNRSLFGR